VQASLYSPESLHSSQLSPCSNEGAGESNKNEPETSNGKKSSLLLTVSTEKREVSVHTWLLRRREQDLRGLMRSMMPWETVLSSKSLGRTMLCLRWSGHCPSDYPARFIYQKRDECQASSRFSGHNFQALHPHVVAPFAFIAEGSPDSLRILDQQQPLD